MQQTNLFMIDDTDKSLLETGGEFGLNTGYITKFEFTENAGKDNSPTNAVDIHFTTKGREYRRRLFETKAELFPEQEDFEKDLKHKVVVIKHVLKALGVKDEVIKNTSATLGNVSIAEGFKKLSSLVPANFSTIKVDVFLEYQWNIQGDNDKTYLELPKNMKGGDFVVPHQQPSKGEWKAIISDTGKLNYVDANGMLHTFERTANFMNSNKAKQQQVNNIFNNNNTTQQQAQPIASTW